jgi:hypothetical protein
VKQLVNTTRETGEWPKDFTEVTMVAYKKKPRATKCSDHCTISPIAYTAKIVMKILRRIERKIEEVHGEDQFGYRTGRGAGVVIWKLRIVAE